MPTPPRPAAEPTRVFRPGAPAARPTVALSADTTPPPPPDPALPRVRGYEVLGVVGRGGMGVVYEARHRQLNRRVAIKTLRDDAVGDTDFHVRFRAEAQAVARLQHPNIIQLFEIGGTEPHPGDPRARPFIALEFVDGGSLADRTRAPQPPACAAAVIETVARAAHAAHLVGVLHRDLKPANVLLTPDGTPKIADFGLAKMTGLDAPLAAEAITRVGNAVGTPEYMAPELYAGADPAAAADTYALGVILYELLTGRTPFQGACPVDTMRLATDQEAVPPRRLQPGVPRDLETICLKCLEKAPARRYATAGELADDLARFAAGTPIHARPLGRTGRAARWVRRNPTVAGLWALVCLVAVAGLAGVVSGWREAEANARAADANAGRANRARTDAEAHADEERRARYRVSLLAASAALQVHDSAAAARALDDAPADCRDWVWRLLHAQLDQARAVYPAAGAWVAHATLTPDGRWAVVTDGTGVDRIRDVGTGREYGPFDLDPKPARPPLVVVDPATGAFATAAADHTVLIRELPAGRVRAVLRGHTAPIYQLEVVAGRVVAAATDATVRVWDAAGGDPVVTFRGPPDCGNPVRVGPDFRYVADRGLETDTTARVWNLATGRPARLGGHGGCAHFVRFNPAGDRVVTAERFPHNNLYLWDVATGAKLATLTGHENQITEAVFSPDGTRLVSISEDRTARLWDVPAGATAAPVAAAQLLGRHTGMVRRVAYNPAGTRVVTGADDRTVRVWDARTGEELTVLRGHGDGISAVGFRDATGEVVSVGADNTVRVWDAAGAESGAAVRLHRGFVYQAAFFPAGDRVASAAWDGTCKVWDPTTGRELARYAHGTETYVVAVAVDPTGRYVATAARQEGVDMRTVRLWDAATGREVRRWKVPAAWQDGRVAFSPDGGVLASGGQDGRVRLWDVATGATVAELAGPPVPVRDVAFSPDGTRLAVGSDDGDTRARVWDVATRTVTAVLPEHRLGICAVAWNRAGTQLATAARDGTTRVWDATTGGEVARVAPGTAVYGVAFSADGRVLAGACGDNLIRVWDVATGRELAELAGHRSYVHHVAFSPDGTRLVSASGDKTLRVWDTLPRAERERRGGPPPGPR